MTRKYQLAHPLDNIIEQAIYEKWLHRKAMAHVKRDRGRGNATAMVAEYKQAIHEAVY